MTKSPDQVVSLSIGLLPESGAPNPILMQNEHDAYVLFEAQATGSPAETGTALVRLRNCLITRFGYPNDEALAAHPLYATGLRFYGVFKVHDSSWTAQLQQQSLTRFPGHRMPARRHMNHFS